MALNPRVADEKIVPKGAILKRLIQVGMGLLILGLSLFISAGRLNWGWAWAFLGIYLGMILANALFMDRELVAERAEVKANTKDWDRWISGISMLLVTPLSLIVAGLDERFNWSELSISLQMVALLVVALGYGLVVWAMISNRFFAITVRIQQDRGQTVVSSGPYRFIRHPGYLGFILTALGIPLMLGSWWGLFPGVLGAAGIFLRTVLEDRTLQQELPGYLEYAVQVRYRLIPGIW